MTTTRRGLLSHFTHISNLVSVVTGGLYYESTMAESQRTVTEVDIWDQIPVTGNAGCRYRRVVLLQTAYASTSRLVLPYST